MKYITFHDELTCNELAHYVNVKAINQITIHFNHQSLLIHTTDGKYLIKLTKTTPENAVSQILESLPEDVATVLQIS